MRLHIDGKPITELSLDQIGATLQQIATEIDRRGYVQAAITTDEVGDYLREAGK